MIWFLLRRLLWMIGTLWVVFTVSFFLMHCGARRAIQQRTQTAARRRGSCTPSGTTSICRSWSNI